MCRVDARSPLAAAAPAGPIASRWLECALVFLVFFIAGGAPAPHVNESHYLTKAKHYWDPSYCPGDFFLDSADAHLAFYWGFGWLTRLVSLTATAWIGRIVAWALLAAAWESLARRVVNRPGIAALSATVWVALIEKANFAGEWVVGGIEAKCIAYALVLLGLAQIAVGKWSVAWIGFGAAAAFHVLVGAWAVLAGMAAWVTEPRASRPSLRSMLPGLIIGGILSLPGLLPALALDRNVDPAVAQQAARIYVFDRLPHHLAPLTLPADELRRRLVRFGAMAACFMGLWAWTSSHGRRLTRSLSEQPDGVAWQAVERMMRFAGASLAFNFAGLAIEAALWDDPLRAATLLRYYWFRLADVAIPLAVALGTGAAISVFVQRGGAVAIVAIVGVLAGGGWYLVSKSLERLRTSTPPAAQKMDDFSSWRNACEWVRDNTPPAAVFLIPRTGQSFKWYASRADVANYKDVPQDAASVVQWKRRCEELFPLVPGDDGLAMIHGSPEQWGTQRTKALARKYGASHVIARSFPPLALPIAYPPSGDVTGSYYAVYETGVSATGAQR